MELSQVFSHILKYYTYRHACALKDICNIGIVRYYINVWCARAGCAIIRKLRVDRDACSHLKNVQGQFRRFKRRLFVEMQLKFLSAILFAITVRSCLIRFFCFHKFNKSLAAIKNVKTLRTIIALYHHY